MTAVEFFKVEGLGNDFILLDRTQADPQQLAPEIAWLRAHAPALCDRRTGIGADGILIVGPASDEVAGSMIVVNFDGSRPEMCGNGLRCVAAFLGQAWHRATMAIDTDAGRKHAEVQTREHAFEVRIDMGPGRLLGSQTPAAGEGRSFIGVSMGNPHAVCFVASDEQPEALARRLGPAVELDGVYAPDKTNVEFARVYRDSSGQSAIELWVWERGVGITQACGTGACATAVAAVHAGLVPVGTAVDVWLPGGRLTITVPSDAEQGVIMTGPCRQVFSGVFEPAAFEGSSSSSSSSP